MDVGRDDDRANDSIERSRESQVGVGEDRGRRRQQQVPDGGNRRQTYGDRNKGVDARAKQDLERMKAVGRRDVHIRIGVVQAMNAPEQGETMLGTMHEIAGAGRSASQPSITAPDTGTPGQVRRPQPLRSARTAAPNSESWGNHRKTSKVAPYANRLASQRRPGALRCLARGHQPSASSSSSASPNPTTWAWLAHPNSRSLLMVSPEGGTCGPTFRSDNHPVNCA